jgi:hypothetical protein
MTAANQQIVTMYEVCEMSVEDIASETGYDLTAVKTALMQCSKKFCQDSGINGRDATHKVLEDLFGAEDVMLAKDAITSLSRGSEVDAVRFRASRFIIDEVKGRNDVRALQKLNINVTVFNEQLARAKEQRKLARERVKKSIDVTSEVAVA